MLCSLHPLYSRRILADVPVGKSGFFERGCGYREHSKNRWDKQSADIHKSNTYSVNNHTGNKGVIKLCPGNRRIRCHTHGGGQYSRTYTDDADSDIHSVTIRKHGPRLDLGHHHHCDILFDADVHTSKSQFMIITASWRISGGCYYYG